MDDVKSLKALQVSLQVQKAAIDKKLKVVEEALHLLHGFKSERDSSPMEISVKPEDLSGLTQLKAIQLVAKRNKGDVTIKALRPLLEQAGILKKTKNWYNIIYGVINRSGLFEHTGPGQYCLIDELDVLRFPRTATRYPRTGDSKASEANASPQSSSTPQ